MTQTEAVDTFSDLAENFDLEDGDLDNIDEKLWQLCVKQWRTPCATDTEAHAFVESPSQAAHDTGEQHHRLARLMAR